MRIGIEEDGVAGASQPRHHAEIGLIAGGEDDAVLAVEKAREFGFQFLVQAISAIGDARAGGAGAELGHRLLASLDAIGIESDPHVIVGASQDRLAPVDDGAGGRDHPLVDDADRIDARRHHAGETIGDRPVLVEQVGHAQAFPVRASTTLARSAMVRVSDSTLSGTSISK